MTSEEKTRVTTIIIFFALLFSVVLFAQMRIAELKAELQSCELGGRDA